MKKQELLEKCQNIVEIDIESGGIKLRNPKNDQNDTKKIFIFDRSFNEYVQQEDIYNQTTYPIVESVLKGYNGTILAYGQTGSGKTHTMEGHDEPPQLCGIIPRTFDHIFRSINGIQNKLFMIHASFLELFNEEIRDLLSSNTKNLKIIEKPDIGVSVLGLSSLIVKNAAELKEILKIGRQNQLTGATQYSFHSSQSHSLFFITIEQIEKVDNLEKIKVGRLIMGELAGSERLQYYQQQSNYFKEVININRSITCLKQVITSLINPKSTNIPYRDSKLTTLLQDSLGGNTQTVLIINIGPADNNYQETLCSLKFGLRSKQILCKQHINEDPQNSIIKQYQIEIMNMKLLLQKAFEENDSKIIRTANIMEQIINFEDKETIQQIELLLQEEKEKLKKYYFDERNKIAMQNNLTEQQKNNMFNKLQEMEDQNRNAKEQQEKLIKQIKQMKDQFIISSTNTKSTIKADEINQPFLEIKEKKQAEQHQIMFMNKQDAQIMTNHQEQKNQKENVAEKTLQIAYLIKELKQLEEETIELEEEFRLENEEEINRRRIYQKELKKLNLIFNYFIPKEIQQKIFEMVQLDETMDIDNQWKIPFTEIKYNIQQYQGLKQQNLKKYETKQLEADGNISVHNYYNNERLKQQL